MRCDLRQRLLEVLRYRNRIHANENGSVHDQETLEWEVVGVWNRQDHDSLFRPKVTYAWNDQLKSSLGAEIYLGRRETFFGSMEELSYLNAD
ncbi:MAG: hypothetical protein M3Q07_14305 [Pseudobdellovibrionaceae bacterium]|nr:hypothetical protein [Pseudobdellovibrionaceae bacterium]